MLTGQSLPQALHSQWVWVEVLSRSRSRSRSLALSLALCRSLSVWLTCFPTDQPSAFVKCLQARDSSERGIPGQDDNTDLMAHHLVCTSVGRLFLSLSPSSSRPIECEYQTTECEFLLTVGGHIMRRSSSSSSSSSAAPAAEGVVTSNADA